MSFKSKVTFKGTELPLISLKGKPYLQVAHRLIWFREEHPNGSITTEAITITDGFAIFKATVKSDEGLVLGTGHKKETSDYGDYVEKAETGAEGRALAVAGYGTQFEPAFDEGSRLVDSPVDIPKKGGDNEQQTTQTKPEASKTAPKSETPKANPSAIETKPAAPVVETASPTPDTKILRTKIKSAFAVLEAQKKITKKDFIDKYLEGGKVDTISDAQVGKTLTLLKTNFAELGL
jgi:hypothetical protein